MKSDENGKIRLYTGSYNAPVLTGDGTFYHATEKGYVCGALMKRRESWKKRGLTDRLSMLPGLLFPRIAGCCMR